MENKLALFEEKEIRKTWQNNKWYFSILDVVYALTDSKDPKQYIKKLKLRDTEIQNNWGTICTLLEMMAIDGKKRKIQMSDTEGILRIIQSIPSPKAEPFKRWLAKVGNVLNKARSEIENELGKSIVTSQNYIELTDTLIETK